MRDRQEARRQTVFVSYRRDDTGWAANALAAALRVRLGAGRVFLDNSSIALGEAFPGVIEDALRDSAVLVVLIGPRWDASPLRERLNDEQDWVRREILLAQEFGLRVVPVLVDRDALPLADGLPQPLRFLCERQCARARQSDPDSVESVADALAVVAVPQARAGWPAGADRGVERTRDAVDQLVRRQLPPAQQWSGNRDRLVDLALAALGPAERLVYLAPARLPGCPRGSATVLLTTTDLVLIDVGEDFHIRGEARLPLVWIGRVEVTPTFPLFADLIAHTSAGGRVSILGLFKDQARRLADHIRAAQNRPYTAAAPPESTA